MFTSLTFIGFISFVAIYTYLRLRKEKLDSSEGYFLGGRSLTGIVIAGSMLLTNISTEHLIGMNGSSYRNGLIIIAWEVTSAIALVAAAIYFVPRYLKMGLTTIPEFLEKRFDKTTRLIVAFFLIVSFEVGCREPPAFIFNHSAPTPSDLKNSSSQPNSLLLGSTKTAPAPSPKSTAVFLSDQSSNHVICSAPITSAFLWSPLSTKAFPCSKA